MVPNGDNLKPDQIIVVCRMLIFMEGWLRDGVEYFDLMTKVYGVEPPVEHYMDLLAAKSIPRSHVCIQQTRFCGVLCTILMTT